MLAIAYNASYDLYTVYRTECPEVPILITDYKTEAETFVLSEQGYIEQVH